MTDHIQELRTYMDIAESTTKVLYESIVDSLPEDDTEIVVQDDRDSIIESLEFLQFKLLNHRQLDGNSDYASGYEEAYIKVVEMIDGIVRNHRTII